MLYLRPVGEGSDLIKRDSVKTSLPQNKGSDQSLRTWVRWEDGTGGFHDVNVRSRYHGPDLPENFGKRRTVHIRRHTHTTRPPRPSFPWFLSTKMFGESRSSISLETINHIEVGTEVLNSHLTNCAHTPSPVQPPVLLKFLFLSEVLSPPLSFSPLYGL